MSFLEKLDHFIEHDVCHTKLGLAFMTMLRKAGVSRFIRKQMIYRMMDRGTYQYADDPRHAESFFEENRQRVERICGWLSDERSRETYRSAIAFRTSLDRHELPKYDTEERQYFDEVVRLDDNEVFVDCGAYIGDTVDRFFKAVNGKYKGIVCFEPDIQNYERLRKKQYERLTVINAGVWNENTELAFASDQATSSKIVKDGEAHVERVRVCAIDRIPECRDASFIKMDIEGSEMNALQGAKNTILNNYPKLAICIYHSNEDMLCIPELIHELVPDYKLYVRHYSYEVYETVLYAIKD